MCFTLARARLRHCQPKQGVARLLPKGHFLGCRCDWSPQRIIKKGGFIKPPFFIDLSQRDILLHHELDGLVETIGADGAEVDAALEVDADGVFTHLQALVELLHSLANEVDDADVSLDIL